MKLNSIWVLVCTFIFLLGSFLVVAPMFMGVTYVKSDSQKVVIAPSASSTTGIVPPKLEEKKVAHLSTPENVKGIYMTSYIASSKKLREAVVNVATTTEINTIIIDIKDYTGKVSFEVNDPALKALNISEDRIQDIDSFIDELHQKNIYVIGRLAVFQDPYMSIQKPDMAVKRQSDGQVWKDRKGISWIDVGSKDYWSYIASLAKESYSRGFDEINFDYIRYPSDGDMQNISYVASATNFPGKNKHEVLGQFFAYLHNELSPLNIPISADLFGMTTETTSDLGIGQKLEDALSYMDYVSPMVYPSHYPENWEGYKNPADHPYEIITNSMKGAITKLNALKNATTTPADISNRLSIHQLRPWIQDFDLGADYGPTEVKAELQASHDLGIDSWLIWNPSNRYTVGALNAQ